MRARRVDKNHSEIVEAFRKLGFCVLDLSRVGEGCPDALISKHGQNVLIEIKNGKGKLTPAQIKFHSEWSGVIHIVRNLEDVEAVVNLNWCSQQLTKRPMK